MNKLLVTGGAGFIGSAVVRLAVKRGYTVSVIDRLTYAGDLKRLEEVSGKYTFFKADICDAQRINSIFRRTKPQTVIHCAAETHVDRSIKDAALFLKTNITGTQVVADASRTFRIKRFIHISTDEVYGDIAAGSFTETSVLNPSSPYSASKAAADLLLKSYRRTFSFPAIIVRPCNNYGPWQYPEKLIPLSILKVLKNEKVPVYADGKNVREWLYVEDCASCILAVLARGRIGEIYNLGSGHESKNITLVRALLRLLCAGESSIEFVKDRPGHDKRYKLNCGKFAKETGVRPRRNFKQGMKETVAWYLLHRKWLLDKYDAVHALYKR